MNTESTTVMTNREMAAVLFNIATLLRREGNVNPFRTAAYERGARALMGLRSEASAILQSEERVPFSRRRHIGKKLHAKIGEMATQGRLDQYAQMLSELPPHLSSLMALPGIGPRSAERIYQALGMQTADEVIQAAWDGRLRRVPGFGPRRVAAIAAVGRPATTAAWEQPRLFDLPQAA